MSTPPDLKVAVKSNDIQCTPLHFCMTNVLFCSCFEEHEEGKINPNCLIQSKTNPGTNHFKIHSAHTKAFTLQVKPDKSSFEEAVFWS